MKTRKNVILNLEWASHPGRDRQMSTLIANYLRYMGYTVIEENIHNGYNIIRNIKPEVMFISNSTGGIVNYQIVKYAKSVDIKVLSLVSEGNFSDEKSLDEEFWGWNKEKIMFEDRNLHWSVRTAELSMEKYPELRSKISVSGGVGFDVFKIAKPKEKLQILSKYAKDSYKKVIGIGCWDFIFSCPKDSRYENIIDNYELSERDRFCKDRDDFNTVLLSIINKHPDILFLLKEHPGNLCGYYASAIENSETYSNVLILKNEESVMDCIGISDFWVIYDSTTALEAWLMNKQTALLNPSGTDFRRNELYKGSSVIRNMSDFDSFIDCFYKNGYLPDFREKNKLRKTLINNIILYDDGMNHVRAGNAVIDLIHEKSNKSMEISIPRLYWIKFNLRWFLSPILKRYYTFNEEFNKAFNKDELNIFAEKRYQEQVSYYLKCGLSKEDLVKFRCQD